MSRDVLTEKGARALLSLFRSPTLTVICVAVLAALTPPVVHEFIGHGSVCLAVGGHPTIVSTSMFWCTVPAPVVAAGGPVGNLLVGLIAFVVARRVARPSLRLYFVLVTAFAWFWEGGYMVQSMLLRRGDYYDFVTYTFGEPGILTSAVIAVAGAALYVLTVVLTRRGLLRVTSGDSMLARRVSRVSWLAATVAVTASAAISPLGTMNLLNTVLSIGLAGIPLLLLDPRQSVTGARGENPLRGSIALPLVTAAVFTIFTATLGHGVVFAP